MISLTVENFNNIKDGIKIKESVAALIQKDQDNSL